MINPYRHQVFALYRDILRTSRPFILYDPEGNLWRDTLRKNARKEIEEQKNETNNDKILQLINIGNESVTMTKNMLKEKKII